MFFEKLLDKMKNLVVIKYRTDNFIDDLFVSFDRDSLKKSDDVSNNSINKINFKQIYENRMI